MLQVLSAQRPMLHTSCYTAVQLFSMRHGWQCVGSSRHSTRCQCPAVAVAYVCKKEAMLCMHGASGSPVHAQCAFHGLLLPCQSRMAAGWPMAPQSSVSSLRGCATRQLVCHSRGQKLVRSVVVAWAQMSALLPVQCPGCSRLRHQHAGQTLRLQQRRPITQRAQPQLVRAEAARATVSVPVKDFQGEDVGSVDLAVKVASDDTAKGLVHRYLVMARQNARAVRP